MKAKFKYKRVKIIWWDICSSDEAWISEDDILNHDIATCSDVGYIYKKTKDKLWLFSSFSKDENGLAVGRVQEAELETSLVKAVGINSPEMRSLKKELNEVKEDNKKLANQINEMISRLRDASF